MTDRTGFDAADWETRSDSHIVLAGFSLAEKLAAPLMGTY